MAMTPDRFTLHGRRVALAALIAAALVLAPSANAQPEPVPPVDTLLAHARERMRTEPGEALQMAEEALALAQHAGDTSAEARSLRTVGDIHYAQNRLDQALGRLTDARQLFETIGDRAGLAGVLNAVGYVYERRGEIPPALRAHLQSLELYEQLGDEENVARVTSCIGVFYMTHEDAARAVRYHRRAVQLYRTLDQPRNLALSYSNLGAALVDAGDYDEAIRSLRHALTFPEAGADQRVTAAASNNLGAALNRSGRPAEALKYLHEALRTAEKVGFDHLAEAICDELARVYLALGDLDLALRYAQRSLALATEIKDAHLTPIVHKLLSEIHASRGEYEQAYAYQQLHSAARDSLFGTEKAEIISQIQTRHEIEGMEREIESLQQQGRIQRLQAQQRHNALLGGLGVLVLVAGFAFNRYRLKQKANRLLTAQNEEISRQREALRAHLDEKSLMLEEKELLVREVHHRVKNNLQVLSSMLRLQAQALEHPAALAPMQDMQARVLSMAFLHRELYGEDDSTHVEMQRYIETLSRSLLHAFNADGRVHSRVPAHGARLNADTAVPLGLILNELLSNALKHAFPDERQGSVRVDLRRADAGDGYELTVSDDGAGWSGRAVPEQTATVGLTLVRMMTRQLGGTVQHANGVGLTHTIRFKAKGVRA